MASHQKAAHTATKPVAIKATLDKRLLQYLAAATVAGIGLAKPSSADAEVVYTPAHESVGIGTLFLDINHDGINDFKLVLFHSSGREGGYSPGSQPQSGLGTQWGRLGVYGYSFRNQVWGGRVFASALPQGVEIGPNGKFGLHASIMVKASDLTSDVFPVSASGPWKGASEGPSQITNHFLGFRFLISGETHYGWARLNVAILKGAKIQPLLTGYAYETKPDTPIPTINPMVSGNAVQPAQSLPVLSPVRTSPSLGLLARGAHALPIWRRGLAAD